MEDEPRTAGLQIAQFNLAVLRHPVGHPGTKGFLDLIDDTNAHAEASPGFVWRYGLDTREDDLPYDDKHITVNASVWESPQALRDFAYRGFHRDVYRQRADWFVDSAAVMWWIEPGTTPTLDECLVRMDFFGEFGTTPYAFTTGERMPVLRLVAGRNELVALLDGEPAGAVSFRPSTGCDDEWSIDGLRATGDPAHHLAAALVTAVRALALATGITALTISIDPRDAELADELRRAGFTPDDQGGVRLAVGPVRDWKRPRRDVRHPGATTPA